MNCRNRTIALLACLSLSLLAANSSGQTTTNIVQGTDGVTYRETRTVSERMIPSTHYQTRQEKTYQPQTVTKIQSYQQNYLTPITEYRWVARQRGVYNPFVAPYWVNQLEPVTRWENRAATVQVPVASTQWAEQQRTISTPVTTYKAVKEETVSRVAISVSPTATPAQPATAIAAASHPQLSPIGGQQLTSDPPRTATGWSTSSEPTNRYR